MPVVSDTSPLLNLAIIGRLELLREQFEVILMPPAVVAELKLESDLPGAADLRQAMQAKWLDIVSLSEPNVARALRHDLDDGEAEAIALSLQLGHSMILIDEHDGRAVARMMGLTPVGILGVLLRAKRQGRLESLQACIDALRSQAGFFVSDELIQRLLNEVGET